MIASSESAQSSDIISMDSTGFTSAAASTLTAGFVFLALAGSQPWSIKFCRYLSYVLSFLLDGS